MKQLTRALAVAIGTWATSGPLAAAEPYVQYENFTASVLDPARWLEGERSRTVGSNYLRLVQRDRGSTASDSGTTNATWTESLTRGGPVTQLRASLRVNAIDMSACAANPSPTLVRARVMGNFFNSGNRVPGNSIGDVFAQIRVIRFSNSADPPGVMLVQGTLSVCGGPNCFPSTQIGSTVSLGTINVGTTVPLQVEWDRANKQFIFARDKGAQTATISYAGIDDSADPGNVFKSVGTSIDAANCASGPRPFGHIDVRFDNVQVNAAAKP